MNQSTLLEILTCQTNDGYFGIRQEAAKNPNTPEYAQDYLDVMEFMGNYEL
jgi:hypothetical protein